MAGAEPTTSSLAASLTRALLHELVTDIAIEEHELSQVRKHRLHQLYYEQSHNASLAPPLNGASPNKKDRDEGLFNCVVCNRQIAAPRYASHLSGCMGLSGSRRGERSRAAAKPSRNGSAASSHVAQTDAIADNDANAEKNGANGLKRSASTASAAAHPKKSKPTPLSSTPSTSQTFQPPHIGSHPLSKTMSLPASPVNSPIAAYPPIPPRPSSAVPGALPFHQQQQQQQQRIPAKHPAAAAAGVVVPNHQPHSNGGGGTVRAPHPLAHHNHLGASGGGGLDPTAPLQQQQQQSNRVFPPAIAAKPPPPTASAAGANHPHHHDADRPDSDSEDSDSDLEVLPFSTVAAAARSHKTPRVPPPSSNATTKGGGGAASLGMQRNGSSVVAAAAGSGASQKQPRKGIKSNPTAAAGRKGARPIAGVNHDSASSDEDVSDGSGSD
ncbi:hypothetical protein JCM11491_006482 [Sporobolomyces phaffii]